jgi:hypothetical protein
MTLLIDDHRFLKEAYVANNSDGQHEEVDEVQNEGLDLRVSKEAKTRSRITFSGDLLLSRTERPAPTAARKCSQLIG